MATLPDLSPNLAAFLDTLAFSEGTVAGRKGGSWLDRLLIGSVGLIIIWFGGKLEMRTTTVQQLCATMVANGEQLRSANQRIDRLQFEQDTFKESYETHLREDRQKFYRVALRLVVKAGGDLPTLPAAYSDGTPTA